MVIPQHFYREDYKYKLPVNRLAFSNVIRKFVIFFHLEQRLRLWCTNTEKRGPHHGSYLLHLKQQLDILVASSVHFVNEARCRTMIPRSNPINESNRSCISYSS